MILDVLVCTLRPVLLADIISSCLHELPAATALAVAVVIGLVYRITSSAVAVRSTLSELSNPCKDKQQVKN